MMDKEKLQQNPITKSQTKKTTRLKSNANNVFAVVSPIEMNGTCFWLGFGVLNEYS